MGQEGLNASDVEMLLVKKHDVELVLHLSNEVFAEADEFMKDETNRSDISGYERLLRSFTIRYSYMSALRILDIISNKQLRDYIQKHLEYADRLKKWFWKN